MIHMVVGCPGSGKSWVCDQLKDKYDYVRHDDFLSGGYLEAILERAKRPTKPILIETPFSISQLKDPIEAKGLKIEFYFIIEDPKVITERYEKRDGKPIPKGHLSRQETYRQRAKEYGGFVGSSREVLERLK